MTINAPGINPEEIALIPPVADAINPVTPFKRLMGSMATSYGGAFIVQAVPVNLLLTLHITAITGKPGAAAAFSVVTGVAALLGLVVQPLTGRFSDRTKARFGKRRSWILVGGLAGGVLVLGMAATTQVWQVVLVWAVVSIFINIQFAATGALLAEQVPAKRRGSMSGVLGSMAILGPVLGLGAVSTTTLAWLQWVIVGASGVVLVVISVSLLKDPQQDRPAGEKRLTLVDLAKSYWLSPRKHPAFGWAWAVRFLVSCTGAAITYNALLLENRFHYSSAATTRTVLFLTLLYGVLIIIFSTIGGVLSDRIQRQKPFVMVAGVVAAVALVLIGFAPTVGALFIATGILGVAAGVFLSVDLALCVRMLPNPENVGKDIAVMSLASTLPSSVVPFMAPLFLALGGYTAFYVAIAVIGLVGAVLVTRLPELGHEGDRRWAQITAVKE